MNNKRKKHLINLPTQISQFKPNQEFMFASNCQHLNVQEQYSKEQVMEWLIINFLSPYMKKTLEDYYGGFIPYELITPSSQILEANYVPEKACFIVKLQIEPFLGAHYPVGLDNFTFKIDLANEKITLEKYEHVKSFKLPDYVKKQHLDLNLQ